MDNGPGRRISDRRLRTSRSRFLVYRLAFWITGSQTARASWVMRRPAVLQLSLYVPGPPALRRLATLLPTARVNGGETLVELADLTPEAVLSACLASGCGVVGSRVIVVPHLPGSSKPNPPPPPGALGRVGALEMAHTDS